MNVGANLLLGQLVFYLVQSKLVLQENHKRRMIHRRYYRKSILFLFFFCASAVYPQVFVLSFFESLFLFQRCSINMYLSWNLLFKSPFVKDAINVSIMIFDTTFLYN